ncbi:hypothetical protein LINGRAHAP2_LOCUS24009 [Linum grandiflorum]
MKETVKEKAASAEANQMREMFLVEIVEKPVYTIKESTYASMKCSCFKKLGLGFMCARERIRTHGG